jgi:hypothetical protein
MPGGSSRREFLGGGLTLPALAVAPLGAGGVRYRTLGRTGLKVSTVGFGCMITSDASVIQRAADMGINHFDTARIYRGGNNERMVGAALKGCRQSVYIASKTQARTRQRALEDLDASLRELGTDYLDVWHLHDRTSAAELTDELLDAQQTAKKQGKIRFAGVSTHSKAEVIRAAVASGRIDVVLTAYNFVMDQGLEPVLEAAHKAGLGVVAMKVMAGGYRNTPYYPTPPGAKARLQREGALLAALKWSIRDPWVHTSIPSMVDVEQLEENFRAMSSPFTEADGQLLAAHLELIRPLYCRMCGSCTGTCPQGLPVADVLRYLTYADGYGQFALGREKFLALPEEARQVRCRECASCAVRCPNGVRVAERLTRAQEWFA